MKKTILLSIAASVFALGLQAKNINDDVLMNKKAIAKLISEVEALKAERAGGAVVAPSNVVAPHLDVQKSRHKTVTHYTNPKPKIEKPKVKAYESPKELFNDIPMAKTYPVTAAEAAAVLKPVKKKKSVKKYKKKTSFSKISVGTRAMTITDAKIYRTPSGRSSGSFIVAGTTFAVDNATSKMVHIPEIGWVKKADVKVVN